MKQQYESWQLTSKVKRIMFTKQQAYFTTENTRYTLNTSKISYE
jgi:hypothetical protein